MADALETYTFSADIAQLMGVIVSTVYANKEIFLRELVSNASDALERRHYGTSSSQVPGDACILVYPDLAAGTLTVEDTGIGMSRDDLVDSLGTIARSKTKAFLEAATASGAEPPLIGQFGIGFYSAYVVSDRVRVISRSVNSDGQYIWESTAGGAFTVTKDSLQGHGELACGTKVVCFLKDGQQEFLDSAYLRQLLMRHSCFVKWPVYLCADRCHLDAVRPVPEIGVLMSRGWELMSRIKPVWLESSNAVSAGEYNEVYRWLEGDSSASEALAVRHVEHSGHSQVDFRAVLFCAQRAASDMFDLAEGRTRGSRVRLFVRRVFVKEFDDLLPKWMTFACGVVDSDDLPLNISREQLQKESAVMRLIGRILGRQCFEMLESLSTDVAKFKSFHDMFGQNLKLGMYEDAEHRARVAPLLRYHTTESGEDVVSLQQYVDRMRPAQRHILYVTGRSRRQALQSPLIEGFRRDGYEVLLMTDPADEFALQVMKEFGGCELMSATTVHAASEGTELPMGRAPEDKARHGQDLAALDRFVKDTLLANNRQCEVAFASCGLAGVAFPAAIKSGTSGQSILELDASHGLLEELTKKLASRGCGVGQAERDLVVLLHELATALMPNQGSENTERRRRIGEQLQEMVRRLDGAFRDADDEDLPSFPLEPLTATSGVHMHGQQGWPLRTSATYPERWPSVGSPVRTFGNDRSRRGIVTFVESSSGTVDVLYCASHGATCDNSAEEEAEGLPLDSVRPLLDFESESSKVKQPKQSWSPSEVVATLSEWKEHGNDLFKLKDYDAALEAYTVVIDAIQSSAVEPGQQVLRVVDGGGHRRLVRSTVRRVLLTACRARVCAAELEDEAEGRCLLPPAALLPVLGLRSLRPLLERAAAFRGLSKAVLELVAAAAAGSALELVSLQAAALTNRARCWSALGCHRRAAQDLTVTQGLWLAFSQSQEAACSAAAAALTRGLCTAKYLRAKARLRRGLFAAAARDVRDALAREPPPAVARQLQDLQLEVWKAMGERHRVREPLARELAKVVFALRTAGL